MSECEICGHMASFKAEIESAVVGVCEKCAHLGKIIEEKQTTVRAREEKPPAEPVLDPDFPKMVKEAREKKGLAKEQLAGKIKEKASVVERVEKGMRPTASVAKKLEKELGISLGYTETAVKLPQPKAKELTVGDVVEVRVKKKK